MPLTKELRETIKSDITAKLKKKLAEYDFRKKSGNPFIDVIFGKYSNIKSFIHGTATMLGSEYELMARQIAQSNPSFVEAKKLVLTGKISSAEKSVITDIVKNLEESGNGSDYDKEVKSVFAASSSSIKPTRITIDLYLKDKNEKEYFIEMKGPDPNKKEVRAAKQDLLNIVAIKKRDVNLLNFNKKVSIIFGVYYNNTNKKYQNWKVSPLFEDRKGLLVQEAFWDFLGGSGTYKDILGMISEVRDEISPAIEAKLQSL
jgi:hypothetical protein